MPDDPGGLWQTVRRALGRLVSATRVNELPLTDLVPAPAIGALASLALSAPGAGALETQWMPRALAAGVPLPQTSAGAGEADLTPAVTVVRMEAAPPPGAGAVLEAALPPPICTTHRLDAANLREQSAAVVSPVVVFRGSGVHQAAVRFAPPETARLPVEAPTLARGTRLRWPGRRTDSDDLLRLAEGRVRPGTGMLAQIPIKRVGRPVPKGAPAADAFPAEWQMLAQKAGVAPEDVVLVGVFPQVPVAAVRRLALEEGALCLWLKPEALVAAAAGRAPRLATLIVGRQRSTGKMIQTVA